MTETLKSEDYYNALKKKSVLALNPNAKTVLSYLLNPRKLLKTETGLLRDWQGLAELCGMSGELISTIAAYEHDPTEKVLKSWYYQKPTDALIETLFHYLEQIDRFDIIDTLLPLINDTEEDSYISSNKLSTHEQQTHFDLNLDELILTRDDVTRINQGLEPQLYDAFILFADDDIDFATELIEIMEKQYNLKLCVKERDLVIGRSECDAVIRLISERCGRLIVIISPAFLESNANKFFFSLAQSIGIEQRQRKIIPCIYKECGNLPPELNCYFKLDFRRSASRLWNFWDKLYDSIKVPENKSIQSSITYENKEKHECKQATEGNDSITKIVVSSSPTSSTKYSAGEDEEHLNQQKSTKDTATAVTVENKSSTHFYKAIKSLKSIVPKRKNKKIKSTKSCDNIYTGNLKENGQSDNKIINEIDQTSGTINNAEHLTEEKKDKRKKTFSFHKKHKKEMIEL